MYFIGLISCTDFHNSVVKYENFTTPVIKKAYHKRFTDSYEASSERRLPVDDRVRKQCLGFLC